MARTLETVQEERALGRESLSRVDLVVLTTFTDRDAGTVDKTFFLSSRPVAYSWAGGPLKQFQPRLQDFGTLSRSLFHLPQPAELGDFPNLRLALLNHTLDGATLWEDLGGRNLLRAQLEVATVLIDTTPPTARDWWDLSGFAGTEHQLWWQGELTQVEDVTATSVALAFARSEPTLDWPRADDDTINDPQDRGKRLPIVVGDAKRVRAVGWQVGTVTTLAESISAGQTGNVAVTDATGLSGTGFTLRISAEETFADAVDDRTVSITARGVNGTGDAPHSTGEIVIEMLDEAIWVASGVPAFSIGDVFVGIPSSGELVRLTTPMVKTPSDAALITGRTVASIRLAQSDLRAALDELTSEGGVTSQPDFVVPGLATLRPVFQGGDGDDPNFRDGLWTGTTTDTPLDNEGDGSFNGLDRILKVSGERVVIRWRLFLQVRSADVGGSDPYRPRIESVGTPGGDSSFVGTTLFGNDEFGSLEFGPWVDVGSGITEDSFNNTRVRIGNDASVGSGGKGEWLNFGIQLETLADADQTQFVEIESAAVGFGLRLFADVQGVPAPDAGFSVAQGTMLENPADIARYVLEQVALPAQAVDDTTHGDAATKLSARRMAGDLRDAGATFEEVVARVGFEGGFNLVFDSIGTSFAWKMLAPNASDDFGTSVRTLRDFGEISEIGQPLVNVASRFTTVFEIEPRAGGERAFRKVLRADPDRNDISGEVPTVDLTDFEQRFGRRQADPFALVLVRDAATAAAWMGQRVRQTIDRARGFGFRLLSWEGYDLQIGDVVVLLAENIPWISSDVTGRIVDIAKRRDESLPVTIRELP